MKCHLSTLAKIIARWGFFFCKKRFLCDTCGQASLENVNLELNYIATSTSQPIAKFDCNSCHFHSYIIANTLTRISRVGPASITNDTCVFSRNMGFWRRSYTLSREFGRLKTAEAVSLHASWLGFHFKIKNSVTPLQAFQIRNSHFQSQTPSLFICYLSHVHNCI